MVKRKPPQGISPELEATIKADVGCGLSKEFRDNAFWLHPPQTAREPTLVEWARIERSIAEERRQRKGRGRPAVPAYTLSQNDALLLMAVECVRGYRQRGMPKKKALDKVEEEWAWVPLSRSTLRTAYNGTHDSLNRHRKRL